jgi:hypothetical protein
MLVPLVPLVMPRGRTATVAVDPFVASRIEDAPRAKPAPGPAFRWQAARPGDTTEPLTLDGPLFGTPGPDLGYALALAATFRPLLRLGAHEHRADAEAVAAEIGMRRAAEAGRAPTADDVEWGFTALGYLSDAPPELVSWRRPRARHAAHDYRRRRLLVRMVPSEVLQQPLDPLRARVAHDWRSLFVEDEQIRSLEEAADEPVP